MSPVVYTPVEGFTGTVVGVHFRDGAGETDDTAALGYFQSAGYRIDRDAPVKGDSGSGDPGNAASEPAGDPATSGNPPADPDKGGDDGKSDDNKGDAPKRPYPQANKAEWFAYLEQVKPGHGLTIEDTTKAELIAAVDAK